MPLRWAEHASICKRYSEHLHHLLPNAYCHTLYAGLCYVKNGKRIHFWRFENENAKGGTEGGRLIWHNQERKENLASICLQYTCLVFVWEFKLGFGPLLHTVLDRYIRVVLFIHVLCRSISRLEYAKRIFFFGVFQRRHRCCLCDRVFAQRAVVLRKTQQRRLCRHRFTVVDMQS